MVTASAHVVGVQDVQPGYFAVYLCHAGKILSAEEFHAGLVVQFVQLGECSAVPNNFVPDLDHSIYVSLCIRHNFIFHKKNSFLI